MKEEMNSEVDWKEIKHGINIRRKVKPLLNEFYDKFLFTANIEYRHNNFFMIKVPFLMSPINTLVGLAGVQDAEFHKTVYSEVKKSTFEKLMPEITARKHLEKEKTIKIVEDYFTASGWGLIQNVDLQMDEKKAIIVLDNSPFARKLKGKTKFPVDTFLRGTLAGMFSKIFDDDIDCVETECAALKGKRCKFIIQKSTKFDFTKPIVKQQLKLKVKKKTKKEKRQPKLWPLGAQKLD
ncbi:MAG: 4-vinyl reductase [archaeon]|jgi:predicted hydrocarbon binding protein